jgi:hypothetical protein
MFTYWKEFDQKYMKPRLIFNYPYVMQHHEEIAKKITDVISEYNSIKHNREGEVEELHEK